jgi:hypothetical protein
MKLFRNLIPLYIIFILGGCGENKDGNEESQSTETVTDQLPQPTDMVTGYMMLKDAFVATDYEDAKAAAITYKLLVTGNVDAGFEKALVSVTDKMIQARNIEEQRVQFEQISMLMYALAGNGQFEGQRLYKQFCPMAFDNKGAYWLSLEENVLNPYFGDRMLKCGYVEEVL